MRPTLRILLTRVTPLMAVATASIALVALAQGGGITLYDGSYATDLSTSTPGNLSPANGTSLAYPTADLSLAWDQVPGADRYQVQVARQSATSADCGSTTAFQPDNITVTKSVDDARWVPTLSTADDGKDIWVGAYCWRVRTIGKGYGAWSTPNKFIRTWSSAISGLKFFNDHDGPIPRTSASSDWATGDSVTRNAGYVTWNALAGASEYQLQVASSRSFASSSIMLSREGIRDTRQLVLHLPDDTYYWRVRGVAPNGTEGAWSSGNNTFTVRWMDPTWSDPAKIWPADGVTQGEIRFGWTPMPGAAKYEYQIGTNSGCFWNPDDPTHAPKDYGSWVNFDAEYDSNDPPNLLSTRDPHPTQCRLSEIRATTINNWVTQGLSAAAVNNINKDCLDTDADPDKVVCEPAPWPVSTSIDFGAIYHGASENVGGVGDYYRTGDGQYYEPNSIYWRARPVYSISQDRETGWKVGGSGTFSMYGSWTQYTSGGANRHHHFDFDPSADAADSVATRCGGTFNVGATCLKYSGSTMQASDSPGQAVDASMQFPLFAWDRFSGAGGYIFEIARDPLFNSIVRTNQITAMSHSLAYVDALPDNSEDTGYWWRAVPCDWDPDGTVCLPKYQATLGGLPFSYGLGGYSDAGVHQTFTKSSDLQVEQVANFEGASPLIRWAAAGVAPTDYAGWSAGISGAAYYEMEIARDPFLSQDPITIKTTVPRLVPFADATDGKVTQLDDGIWYYRVRAVDDNDLGGGWSDVGSFNKRVEAPVPTGTDGATGAGVAVGWSAVTGAAAYEVQWSSDSSFQTGATSGTTLQTTFPIPGSPTGTYYWRVRALVGSVKGQWSTQTRSVTIVPATTIRYGLNRDLTPAKDRVQITGELKVSGAPRNGERLRLQRKTGGCDASSGSYVDSSVAITGDAADDGMVNIPARVDQNTCFRFAWSGTDRTRYSAPIAVKVTPLASVANNRKVVRRGKPVCAAVRSNVSVNGRVRFQYKSGKSWQSSRTVWMRGAKSTRVCATLTRAGRYTTRVAFDQMTKPGASWTQFENFTKATGSVRVNDAWRIVRSR